MGKIIEDQIISLHFYSVVVMSYATFKFQFKIDATLLINLAAVSGQHELELYFSSSYQLSLSS